MLVPRTHFTGAHTSTDVTLNLPQLQSQSPRSQRLTGVGRLRDLSITVGPQVQVRGHCGRPAGHHELQRRAELRSSRAGSCRCGAAGAASASSRRLVRRITGGLHADTERSGLDPVDRCRTTLTVFGVSPRIELLRWIALIGLLLSIAVTLYFYLRKRGEPFEETFRIQAQYGHMIVPIVGGEDLGWPPVDVPNIKALVRLAESGQRLILHNRSDNVDTYMVNEEGTVYRYQVKPSKVVWGDWSEPTAPLEEAA